MPVHHQKQSNTSSSTDSTEGKSIPELLDQKQFRAELLGIWDQPSKQEAVAQLATDTRQIQVLGHIDIGGEFLKSVHFNLEFE